ncbi:MAG: DUF933 domain-containing protein [Candidatus Omnitrophota bacterium]
MKIGIFSIDSFSAGKENIVDQRIDQLKGIARSAKKVYIQVEIVTDPGKLRECDGVISLKNKQADLILGDLDFTEKRISNTEDESEKALLNRFKEQLEGERFISELDLSEEENRMVSGYSFLTIKPIFLIEPQELEDQHKVLASAYANFGYIAFFTAGEKEARAWSIKKGMTCWQASGSIHSAIQKGFIRGEVISFNDLINDGSVNQARTNNHMRLEGKEYIVQDGDLINFRFNK